MNIISQDLLNSISASITSNISPWANMMWSTEIDSILTNDYNSKNKKEDCYYNDLYTLSDRLLVECYNDGDNIKIKMNFNDEDLSTDVINIINSYLQSYSEMICSICSNIIKASISSNTELIKDEIINSINQLE